MHSDTVKTDQENSLSANALGLIDEKCEGCDRIKMDNNQKLCAAFPVPSVRWRLGNCNMATHIKTGTKTEASKVRVGQQKQKKK
jgi:hypothetical protein